MSSTRSKRLLLLFFLSGFAALIYEVIWARMLSIVFGSTVEAISAVVTAFMAGLAAGSYFTGKWIEGREDTLRVYSLTEFGIGILGLSLYLIFLYFRDIYLSFGQSWTSVLFSSNSRFFLEFVMVFIPSTLIGATFPLMAKAFIPSYRGLGRGISSIYAVNTLGAVLGAFISGFLLLPKFGMRVTVFAAVSINTLLAVTSYLFYKSELLAPRSFPEITDQNASDPMISRYPSSNAISVLLATAVSGFASLAYQIAWTRVLIMVIGNSVYAFTTILTTFLAGIAIGSSFFVRRIDSVRDKVLLLGLLQLLLCFTVIGTLPMINSLPDFFLLIFRKLPVNFSATILIEFAVSFTVMLVPTILMGASFPVAASAYVESSDKIWKGLGALYSANTIGAIFGAFLTGFFLIPSLGVQKTIIFVSMLNLVAFVILVKEVKAMERVRRITYAVASIILFMVSAAAIRPWNLNVLNRGVYVYAEWLKQLPDIGLTLTKFSDEMKLLSYEEGREGTVAVTQTDDAISLQINGKTDAGTSNDDMTTQIMLALLPLTAHPDPQDIAIVGLGSGITLGAAERFPVKRIDCIEILPEVAKANRYFSTFNHNALNDPRANLIIADARQYLSTTKKNYDVIINEPSNPWISSVSNLFTLRFFQIAKSRLKEDGVICQWLHLYALDTKEVKILLNTFRSVFPHVSVWAFTPDDLIVLGSRQPMKVDNGRIEAVFSNPKISEDLSRAGIRDSGRFESARLISNRELEDFCRGVGLNTDDRPIVEFEAPKALYRSTSGSNMAAILSSAARVNSGK